MRGPRSTEKLPLPPPLVAENVPRGLRPGWRVPDRSTKFGVKPPPPKICHRVVLNRPLKPATERGKKYSAHRGVGGSSTVSSPRRTSPALEFVLPHSGLLLLPPPPPPPLPFFFPSSSTLSVCFLDNLRSSFFLLSPGVSSHSSLPSWRPLSHPPPSRRAFAIPPSSRSSPDLRI